MPMLIVEGQLTGEPRSVQVTELGDNSITTENKEDLALVANDG